MRTPIQRNPWDRQVARWLAIHIDSATPYSSHDRNLMDPMRKSPPSGRWTLGIFLLVISLWALAKAY